MTYGLNGIFNNGVLGMTAFAEAMGTISDNIANIQTIGYKRSETQFSTILGASDKPTRNTQGVVTSTRQLINLQGQITQTGNAHDIAINGGGMFVFGSGTADAAGNIQLDGNYYYSRAGNLKDLVPAFQTGNTLSATQSAYLANQQGLYLLAVPIAAGQANGANATVPTSTSDLVPIQVNNQAAFPGQATTTATLTAVIPSPDTAVGAQALSSGFDDTADLTATGPLLVPGDTFDVTVNGNTYPITIAAGETLQSLSAQITAAVGTNTDLYASVTGTAPNASLTLSSPYDISITDSVGAAGASLFGASPTTVTATTVPDKGTPIYYIGDDIQNGATVTGQKIGLTLNFTDPVTIPGVSTTWMVSATNTHGTTTTPVAVTFDNQGRVSSGSPMTINDVITDGTNTVTNTFSLDLSGLAQLGGSTGQPTQINYVTDGLVAGLFEGLEIQPDGTVLGKYTGGGTQALYRIPVGTFGSPNQLEALSGGLYQPTAHMVGTNDIGSGDVDFRFPGDDFSTLDIGSVEASNTDIADSFSQIIITQRAYSSAATVVRTADEMSVVARDLKR